MAGTRWEQIEALFDGALDQPPAERQTWLARSCHDDELRREVEQMVAAHDREQGVLEKSVVEEPTETRVIPAQAILSIKPDRRTMGPYQLRKQIGRGGMGVVYRAHDPRLDRDVAVKCLLWSDTGSDDVRRFVHEAKAASSLDHPNICTVYDVGETEDGERYIAMAYYEGETLAKRLDRGPLAATEVLDLGIQVAQGLVAAHAAGIIHRDIKPANLMLLNEAAAQRRRADRVKILDFGIAKLEGSSITGSGMTPGTLAYMSPEQLGGGTVDERTDLWSLGIVLYEALAAEKPFRGEHQIAVAGAILRVEPRPLRNVCPDVPRPLERVVARLLTKSPAGRHASAAELVTDLEDARREIELGFAASEPEGPADAVPLVRSPSPGPASPDDGALIAVVPFVNLDADPGEDDSAGDDLSDGLAEDILLALGRMRELRVVARGSSFAFRDQGLDGRAVGRKLGAAAVLEGSVRRAGNRLRLNVQLIDVAVGCLIWTQRFERVLEDVVAARNEISQAVAEQLKTELVPTRGSGTARAALGDIDIPP